MLNGAHKCTSTSALLRTRTHAFALVPHLEPPDGVLDLLRQSRWRGSGYVRWAHPSNRGFLRCLVGLKNAAAGIEEHDEVDRIDHFLTQLDPSWDRVIDGGRS